MQEQFMQIKAAQQEIYQAVMMGNYLAVAGRFLEIGIGILLGMVLVRLNEICRRRSE